MLHKEFTDIWYWKKYVENNYLWVQCVWIVKKYCEMRGFPIKSFWGSAINGWNTGIPFDDKWVRINYKKWLYPKQWDLVFWSEWRCKYWHVAVANKFCNTSVLRCFDQNGGGKWEGVTPRFYNYSHVLWWFSRLTNK